MLQFGNSRLCYALLKDMSYKILDPRVNDPRLGGQCALAIMAKAPREGKVKTRLSPPLTLAQTAALNTCFLRDTAASLGSVPKASWLVCYTPVGEEAAFDEVFPEPFTLIPQRGGVFGERLLAAAQDILACGYQSVCLIDSDSPTVPAEAYAQAVEALALPGDRVVLGPSYDGGYYLIGLKAAHESPFQNISWSTPTVARETRQRCCEALLEVVDLPVWYDVDDQETLTLLQAELLNGTQPPFATMRGYAAPATRDFLKALEPAYAFAKNHRDFIAR